MNSLLVRGSRAPASLRIKRDNGCRFPKARRSLEAFDPNDARYAQILPALPRPARHILWAGQGSACGLHHAQTFRFPLVADKSAASALHPAL
jgi:hypothetical protein